MYSFQPMVFEGMGATYFGCGVIVILLAIFGFLFALISIESSREDSITLKYAMMMLSAGCFTLCIAVIFLAINKKPTVYKNEQVIGEFIGFSHDTEVKHTGKHGNNTTVKRNTYVTYNIPGAGAVTLPANTGQVYPQRVILYKN